MKRIMSGKKFATMLRYLHVCSLEHPGETAGEDSYDPAYKVAELCDYLQQRFHWLFIPGQQLSLDETLIRTFGRIKFKVRIISKSARYGIKIYVLTDAATAFVVRIIIYTGKFTYHEADNEKEKKTVQVVKQLCRHLAGSHQTIYVDRFYTSIELLKELKSMDLYVTGTVMKNRISRELTIAKSSKAFKEMDRGDFKKHLFVYRVGNEAHEAGLVCWKDRDVVYCITNETETTGADECKCRTKNGLITIQRPRVISQYNQHMGGVDLADMRRLHCNSTIMGQNRWWLKLFFYLLDVGTSNSLVLYKLAKGSSADSLSIVEFKELLVQSFLGSRMESIPSAVASHVPEKAMGRNRCAYCSLLSTKPRRTSGMVGKDCFTLCHANEEVHQAVKMRYQVMKRTINDRYK